MLVLLTSKWRQRAAAFTAVLFALCLLSPVAAFAFSDTAAHCLTMTEASHVKSGSTGHQHDGAGHADHASMPHDGMDHGTPAASGGSDPAVPGKCCGLFCVGALAPPVFGVTAVQLIEASEVALPATESLWGRSPSRIDRPPRVLLSF